VRPDNRELEDEIRGHLALSIKDYLDRDGDPDSARRAALREFGYVPAIRDSMRRVWYSRGFDAAAAFACDVRIGLRSLRHSGGLAVTVVIMLALGIGANTAVFSVIRGVLLRPLVNRDEDRLIYIRQSAPGIGKENTTFSVPEINDIKSRIRTVTSFGDFSTTELTLAGLALEPRTVKAGVVGGNFFDAMGLRPVLGRLLTPKDDDPKAPGVAVLTYRFWADSLNRDPTVIGRTVRLGPGEATIVGVLEPSVPYPAETELIANIVTSPHHLGATMVTNRVHRMTELFGRLVPGASLDDARAELAAVHSAMIREHREAYPADAQMQIKVSRLRDQIAAPARPMLWLLFAAAAVVFIIACSNVANLILARSVRREGELAIRAALGAGPAALRRMLLAESLTLCGAGALLAVIVARPLSGLIARYAARFSPRALDVSVDTSVLWLGATLAIIAAVLLAFVPRLPSPHAPAGLGLASGTARITQATSRRLRAFATTQVAFSFVLLAAAGMLMATLVAMQAATTGYNMPEVLAVDIPTPATGVGGRQAVEFYREATHRIRTLPGVQDVAVGSFVPWRDAGTSAPSFQFTVDGYGGKGPRARLRIVAPHFFSVIGTPLQAGRDFTDDDGSGREPVLIVSESIARLVADGNAVNRHLTWLDPLFNQPSPQRIVGVVADADDENLIGQAAMTVYYPVRQLGIGGRLFVHASGDPYAVVPAITHVIRTISPNQPVERAATLDDVRRDALSRDRLNAFVLSGFASVAMLISVVGVAGVLAFSVTTRTREIGVRLAIGCTPRAVLTGVIAEGMWISAIGILSGAAGGYVLVPVIRRLFEPVHLPGALPIASATALLVTAVTAASLLPAVRASRVDVLKALRAE
jgi:predicted permease